MNPKALYREIGLIDESLIEQAGKAKPIGVPLWHWLSLAACLALVVAAVGIWQGGLLTPNEAPPGDNLPITSPGVAVDDTSGDHYALILNHATAATATDRIIEGHFWQELTDPELAAVFPTGDGREKDYTITATANFSQTELGTHMVDVVAQFVSGEGITAQVTTSSTKITQCYRMDGEPVLSEIGGVPIEAGYFDDSNDDSILYYAYFKLHDVYYYVEMQGGKAEKAELPALVDYLIAGGKADFAAIAPHPPLVLRNDSISLQEACGDVAFGAFVPKSFPDGYTLNEARRFVNQQSDELSVSLSKGMDDLRWSISQLTDESRRRITSVADRKNYVLSLYPIPRAESVPEELWEIVNRPIFSIEELSLEVVKARADRPSDIGDTGGWQMNFGVLYGDVLVEVSSKGLSPEVVFNLLTQVAPK